MKTMELRAGCRMTVTSGTALRRGKLWAALVFLVVCRAGVFAAVPTLEPRPLTAAFGTGELQFPSPVLIVVRDGCAGRDRTGPDRLAAAIQARTGATAEIIEAAAFAAAAARPAFFVGAAARHTAVARLRAEVPDLPVPPPGSPEAFAAVTGPFGVLVEGADAAGTFYGILTVIQCLQTGADGALVCPEFRITDRPDFPRRVAMLGIWGPGPGEITNMDFPFARELVTNLLAPSRYNAVLISAKFRYEDTPEAGHLYPEIKAELRDLIQLCRLHFIEPIPIHDPRHLAPAVSELYENPDQPSNICYRHPRAFPLLFRVWAEIIELFEPRQFHFWLDEVSLHRPDQYGMCPRCRGTPASALMAEGVSRMAKWLVDRGIEPAMWGDQYLDPVRFEAVGGQAYSAFGGATWEALDSVPRSLVIYDWHYSGLEEYPSVDYFLDKGFPVLGCSSTYDARNWENFARYCLARGGNQNLLGMHQTAWVMTMRRADYDREDKPTLGFYDDAAPQDGVRRAGLVFWRAAAPAE